MSGQTIVIGGELPPIGVGIPFGPQGTTVAGGGGPAVPAAPGTVSTAPTAPAPVPGQDVNALVATAQQTIAAAQHLLSSGAPAGATPPLGGGMPPASPGQAPGRARTGAAGCSCSGGATTGGRRTGKGRRGSRSAGANGAPTPPANGSGSASGAASGTRQKILDIARGEIGVRETGGEDVGKRIDEYRRSTRGSSGSGTSWCADFASWVFRQAGVPLVDNNGDPWTVRIANWGKQKGTWHDKGWTPRPGDLIFFRNEGGNPFFVNHVEIVERVDADGTIHTIGGNTSDQVKRNTFKPNASNIVGFVDAAAAGA